MSEQNGVMVVFAGFTGGDGEFFDACQATVRPGDPSAAALRLQNVRKFSPGTVRSFPRQAM